MHTVSPPVLPCVAELEQHRVCNGLPTERGASSPEGDWDLMLDSYGQDAGDLVLGVDLDHQLGVEPVEGGVCAIGKGPHSVCELPSLGHKAGNLLHEGCVSAILHTLAVNVAVDCGGAVRLASGDD